MRESLNVAEGQESLKKVVEDGRRQPRDGRREDPFMPSASKYHGTKANLYSIECRTGGEASGCSLVSGPRSEKAEMAIRRKKAWSRFIVSISEKVGRRRDVRYPEKGWVWHFEEQVAYRDEGGGNRNNRTDG
jgi:hypothetical protein